MGKIGRFVILIFIIYAWALGYCLCTLLKTCEGENLQDCVSKAESMLQDPNMTFPDDNETLQSVCRMWEDMTVCTYNYTSRCLTRKENEEFHQYFQEPMTSMKTVCTDKDSSEEYFRHAHCIKRISTGENYCGTQYQIMIDQIISVTMNSMKKICCAMRDFKECVMTMNANHVCRGGPYEEHDSDEDIATYAFRTLDKSLLAFVAHSCLKEGFYGQKCSTDDESHNDLGQLVEERMDPASQASDADIMYGTTNEEIQIEVTMSQTQKPLLVPLSPIPYINTLYKGMRVNVTISGNNGKTLMGRIGPYRQDDGDHDNNVAIGRSLREKDMPMGFDHVGSSHMDMDNQMFLETKLRNASNWYHNISRQQNRNSNSNSEPNSNSFALAERRIDADVPKESTMNTITHGNDNLQDSYSKINSSLNATRLSRVNSGRALNFLEPSLPIEGNTLLTSTRNNNGVVYGHQDNSNPTLEVIQETTSTTNAATLSAAGTTVAATNTNPIPTVNIVPSTATTSTSTGVNSEGGKPDDQNEMQMDSQPSRSPRIINSGVSSPGTFNQNPGTTRFFSPPPSTTTMPSKKSAGFGGKGDKGEKGKKKALLDIANTTMKTDEGKNQAGNFSVSDVPIKVFMVWLSTFFV